MSTSLEINFIHSVGELGRAKWQALIDSDYPFIQYEFFDALEKSAVTSAESGWLPYHLVVSQMQEPVALMPLYIKNHSYGEYVFDFQWANAYHQAGIDYYPKLVTAIPYTPATGKRIYINPIVASTVDFSELLAAIKQAILSLAEQQRISSWHILFADQKQTSLLSQSNLPTRSGIQFHWFNRDYQSFDDFLNLCRLKQRKNIKRERRVVAQQNFDIEMLQGEQITNELWQRFFVFYQLTYVKRSGHGGYLNQAFFDQIGQSLTSQLVMSVARLNDEVVAAALFFKDSNTLYGRYWGCLKEFEMLHFELCYYRGIDYCIKQRLDKFDAGAQGEHKIQRGFTPIKTYSNHWVFNAEFAQAIDSFLNQESVVIDQSIAQLSTKLPFKTTE